MTKTTALEMKAEKLERPAGNLDAILGRPFPVLDKGHVRVIDYMGDDAAIVQAARVSYGKGTKKVSEDAALIRFLMRHHHTTPFEMCEIKFHVRVPMDCWRQWIRHRTASVNEYSTRYSEAIDDKQATQGFAWRAQSKANKQGSGETLSINDGSKLSVAESVFHEQAATLYRERLDAGVAREQARKDLPLSTYTEAYWKTDLHNLFNFLALRLDSHAQLEIRSYAEAIAIIVQRWVPEAWSAFEAYRLKARTLSESEFTILRDASYKAGFGHVLEAEIQEKLKGRERDEALVKFGFK